ncbi:MAG TPA: STAS domain-containing protein [Candidatus Baltobacteraceae bacterium]|jgi:anti-sigma B factor antagonist|nr:STAS domain-containing protein [Candidatus Baltobacteraceae bacterium]
MLSLAALTHTVVKLSGELDFATRASTQAILSMVDADVVIVDLTEVTFLDGGALGSLVALKKRLRECGRLGIVKIVTPNVHFQHLFRVTGLTRLFDLHDSMPDAKAA